MDESLPVDSNEAVGQARRQLPRARAWSTNANDTSRNAHADRATTIHAVLSPNAKLVPLPKAATSGLAYRIPRRAVYEYLIEAYLQRKVLARPRGLQQPFGTPESR